MLKKDFDLNRIKDQLQMKAIATRRPLTCTFELTYRCNFLCPMCFIRMTDTQAAPFGRLRTVDDWLDMAKQVHNAGVLYLNLTGGECTLYPGFVRLYEELSKMGFLVTVMTNASAFSDEVKQVFRQYPPWNVNVTLYGASNDTYERVTGDSKGLDKVLANIGFLQKIGVPINATFTMIKQNAKDYPEVGRLCQQHGISYSLITDITGHSRNSEYSDALNCRLSPAERACVANHSPDDIEIALKNAIELEQELNNYQAIVSEKDAGYNVVEVNSCRGARSAVAIYWNGEMGTCISMEGSKPYKPFEVGFEKAWNQIQDEHDTIFKKATKCVSCTMQEDCLNNCSARNYEGTGDFQTPDPYICQYVWLYRKYREKIGSL